MIDISKQEGILADKIFGLMFYVDPLLLKIHFGFYTISIGKYDDIR